MENAPRFEFRSFGSSFDSVRKALSSSAPGNDQQESREVYLLRRGVLDRNVKLRDGRLEVKILMQHHQDLEQWRPAGQYELPIAAAELFQEVFPGLGDRRSAFPEALPPRLEREDLLGSVADPRYDLFRAHVRKVRHRFDVDNCAAEVDAVWVNGAATASVCLESQEPEAVQRLRRQLGLASADNVSYLLAISRILGLEPPPDADRYG